MNNIFDLSQPITNEDSCSFTLIDRRPVILFEEGETQAFSLLTSCFNNLHSNLGTHLDFPGHLPMLNKMSLPYIPSIGQYHLNRFIGRVLIVDFSSKLNAITHFFDESGKLKIEPTDGNSFLEFLERIKYLEITSIELEERVNAYGYQLRSFKGLLLYSGLSHFWKYKKFDSWEYLYFFNPYLSEDACNFIINNGLSFVGIDALQLETPISNFSGNELPLVLNNHCRNYVYEQIKKIHLCTNHHILLGNDVLIYENLNIPPELINREIEFSGVPLNFQIENLNDNALVRPYAVLNS